MGRKEFQWGNVMGGTGKTPSHSSTSRKSGKGSCSMEESGLHAEWPMFNPWHHQVRLGDASAWNPGELWTSVKAILS